jgi:hypothetical protein
MLACATNLFQRLAFGSAIGRASDRYLSSAGYLLAFVDCGGSDADRDFAGARS